MDQAVELSSFHHHALAPLLNPVPGRIEWRFRIETTLPYDLLGIVDLIEEGPTGRVIRDLKTSKRAPSDNKVTLSNQLTMYFMASKYLDGKEPVGVALDYLIPRKGGAILNQYVSRRDQHDEDVFMARVNRAVSIIQSGAFSPAVQGEDWRCNPKYCAYTDRCPFFNRRK